MKNKYQKIFERIAKENNITWKYSFKSNTGRTLIKKREILISRPINKARLQVALHEISHILLGEIKPVYLEEYLVEQMSFKIMKENNIPIKKKIKEISKHYIAYMTQKAIHRGLNKIDKRVKNYIKKEYPKTAKGEYAYV